MTQQYPKRLIEVDLPIKRISAHAGREKSIRHGHISTLHIWWARRPLAACRAVICAALWPDPADPLCPQDFRDKASKLITGFANAAVTDRALGESCDHQTWVKWHALVKNGGLCSRKKAHWTVLRFALLDFIADFANWGNSTVREYLDTSRALTQAAHEALGGEPGTRPLVADPFAGGGAIPVEALRIGADTFASDLNPIPVLLNKVVLEYIPKYGQRLAHEVRKWGEYIKREAEKQLDRFYPKDADGATPIAYLWARTIQCEGPGCGAEVPLIRSLWLAKKGKESVALKIISNAKDTRIHLEIIANAKPTDVGQGSIRRGAATCPCCGYTTPADRTRAQFQGKRGGLATARLLVVVTTRPNESGRFYRVATNEDLKPVRLAEQRIREIESQEGEAKALLPDEQLPYLRSIFNIHLLDVKLWRDLFSPRQLLTVSTFLKVLRGVYGLISTEDGGGFAEAVATILACVVDREAEHLTSICRWNSSGQKMQATFGRQALPIFFDFCEANPFGDSVGAWDHLLECVMIPFETTLALDKAGTVCQSPAQTHPLPDDAVSAFITDPPYYDAVPYADLSDFFYVWLKRSVGAFHTNLFKDTLSPKKEEAVQLSERNPIYSYKTKVNFELLMKASLAEGRRVTHPGGIGVIVFAHKTTDAWETMLQAVIDAAWVIVASWPIDTEMGTRLRAMNSATLSSSVHLVCRPRDNPVCTSSIGDWRDVLGELPRRIHDWMPRLADEGVVGADAIFACLGPALEAFSRYSSVEKASGETVALREYLEHVWAAVSKEALAMVFKGADATGFEADARLTAMWLWTIKSPDTDGLSDNADEDREPEDESESEVKKAKAGGFALEYDAARKIAQGLGADLESLDHLVEITGDQARLLPVSERTRHLFGKEEEEPARQIGRKKKSTQLDMFAELTETEDPETAWKEKTVKRVGDTTLDRVHQGMILFAAGRGEALKRFVVEDGVGRDGKFWRLAQALSALYPSGSDENRWVDGVLARKKQFGF